MILYIFFYSYITAQLPNSNYSEILLLPLPYQWTSCGRHSWFPRPVPEDRRSSWPTGSPTSRSSRSWGTSRAQGRPDGIRSCSRHEPSASTWVGQKEAWLLSFYRFLFDYAWLAFMDTFSCFLCRSVRLVFIVILAYGYTYPTINSWLYSLGIYHCFLQC